jgi:hypothetical protein
MAIRASGGQGGGQGGGNGRSSGEDQFLQDLANSLNQSGGGQSGSDYPGEVYMGRDRQRVAGREEAGSFYTDRWVTGEEASLLYNSWSEKKRRDFIAQAKIGGLLQPEAGEMEGAQLWRALVEAASYYGVDKKQKVSPWDILSSYTNQAGTTGEWTRDTSNPDFEVNLQTGERRYVGPQFKTTTQTSVDFTDPSTAAAIATSLWQQLMGRDPGAGELGTFAEALRQAEERNPITATTTTEFDPTTGEAIGSNTVTEGGMTDAGRQYLAEQRVKGTQEYADVQAATTYADAFENLIWGAPNLGGV